ncbi:TetR/AcrR family transcriptional regulator [Thalassobacillus pellis]|uniref:TetR/AcrR family transcriptional regulator n=1 Tax=Thalassobacillus pellis TaxID=748008 RepID=UPI001960F80C|nr:TetR/AcrR family transcriptional regulator [Thalassobacillus pellis]MBM7554588.1 AcrR family transcriptional regulator [Thalassobacillus pellis]
MPARMPDKRYEKGEKTKENLLQVAITIMAEQGLKEVSAAKLAKATGISKSTVFHHFHSTEALLLQTLDLVFQELWQYMKADPSPDTEHFLETLGQSMVDVATEEPSLVKAFLAFFHEGLYNATYREVLVAYSQQMNDFFFQQLQPLAPHLKEERIRDISKLLLPMIDGMGFHFLLNKDPHSFAHMWKLQTQGILHLIQDQK